MLVFVFLLSVAKSVFCVSCGVSLIPFTFEVLESGATVMGCARPLCFGWSDSGRPIPSGATFNSIGGQLDGYERERAALNPGVNSDSANSIPQQAVCENEFGSNSCSSANQWVGGLIANFNSTEAENGLQCCSYEPLRSSSNRGIATLEPEQIVLGGEVFENGKLVAFDYISNVNKIFDENGKLSYEVNIRRMSCIAPVAPPIGPVNPPFQPVPQILPPQQPAPFIPQVPQYPIQAVAYPSSTYQSYYCFPPTTTVVLKEGIVKTMDHLKVGDFVLTLGKEGPEFVPVVSWIHRVPDLTTEFRRLEMEDGTSVSLTAEHYIYRSECEKSEYIEQENVTQKAVFAIDVNIGDCLFKYEQDGIKMTKVKNITTIMDTGIYAPMTSTGNILVDGYFASCHAHLDMHSVIRPFFDNFNRFTEKISKCFGGYDQAEPISSTSMILDVLDLILPDKHFLGM